MNKYKFIYTRLLFLGFFLVVVKSTMAQDVDTTSYEITTLDCSSAPAQPGAMSFSPSTISLNGTLAASVPVVSGAKSYVWTLPSGLTGSSTTNSITITGTVANTYPAGSIKCAAVNDCGTSATSNSTAAVVVYSGCGAYIAPGVWKAFLCYNLGANPNMTIEQQMTYTPTYPTEKDATVYGDLYQWGRKTDGHEKRNSSITLTKSSTNVPGHGNFILAYSDPGDWRNPQNDALWGAAKTINDPCPDGYRVPTNAEWEGIMNANTWTWNNSGTEGYKISPDGGNTYTLFLPAAGFRHDGNAGIGGCIHSVANEGHYWSSSVDGTSAKYLDINGAYGTNYRVTTDNGDRGYGMSVRCVKEDNITNLVDIKSNQIKVYPNPVKDEIIIENAKLNCKIDVVKIENERVQIIDFSGRTITNFQFSTLNFQLRINVSQLPSGIYILRIGNYTSKFVKG